MHHLHFLNHKQPLFIQINFTFVLGLIKDEEKTYFSIFQHKREYKLKCDN
jgi:hypothetical protein